MDTFNRKAFPRSPRARLEPPPTKSLCRSSSFRSARQTNVKCSLKVTFGQTIMSDFFSITLYHCKIASLKFSFSVLQSTRQKELESAEPVTASNVDLLLSLARA